MTTLRESVEALKNGDNIVIYPEDSTKGYLEQLEGFHPGFVSLAEVAKKRGMDVDIYVTYFRKKDRLYIVDRPVKYSELTRNGETREEVVEKLLTRCNELGRMEFSIPEGVAEWFLEEEGKKAS